LFPSLVLLVMENALEDVALVVGTQQNLSNPYYLDIYGSCLAATLGATEFIIVADMNWVTLCCAT
jgi:hypothetical protein